MLEISAVLEIYSAFIVGAVWVCSYFFLDDVYDIRRYRRIPYVLLATVLLALLADAYALTHSNQRDFLFYLSELVVYATHFINLTGTAFYCAKIFDIQDPKEMRLVYVTIPLAIIGFILWTISLVSGNFGHFEPDGWQRGPLYYFGSIPGVMIAVILFYLLYRHRNYPIRHIPAVMLIAFSIPLALTFFRQFNYQLQNVGIALSIVIVSLVVDLEQIQEKRKLEVESISANTAISLSQIKPHFLYNCIASIGYLCEKDPKAARKALSYFSNYLRGNLDAIDNPKPISLEKEMEHVKSYVALEKMRFGDRVRVEYDLQNTDIDLPAITVQPIVENAIKHGITKKENGGTVKISTYGNKKEDIICIEDDGVGFDVNATNNKATQSIALNNIKERIRVFCDGRLNVESTPDKGTKITIYLPKNGGWHNK